VSLEALVAETPWSLADAFSPVAVCRSAEVGSRILCVCGPQQM